MPGSLLASLSAIEDIGGVRQEERMSTQPSLVAAVRSAQMERSQGAAAAKKAPPYTLAMLISLELYVVDESFRAYERLLAFVKLPDSRQGVWWASSQRPRRPGRKHQTVHFFIDSLVGPGRTGKLQVWPCTSTTT